MGGQFFGHPTQRTMDSITMWTGQLMKPRAATANGHGCLHVQSALMADEPSYRPVRVIGIAAETAPWLTRNVASRVNRAMKREKRCPHMAFGAHWR